jgi:hypothetical protein
MKLLVVAALVFGALGSAGRAAAADFTVTPSGMSAWVINGQTNPGLTLVRGHTYAFGVNAPGQPFWIKTIPGVGTSDSFDSGVTNNGLSGGTLTFAVPASAPSLLYYQCQFHDPMTGTLTIVAPPTVPATTGLTRGLLGVGLALLAFAVLARRSLRERNAASDYRRLAQPVARGTREAAE